MRRVIWSADARHDYLDILQFVAADNPLAVERVADAIEQVGNGLGEFATGRPGRVTGSYEKSVARLPYIIAYEIKSHGGQEVIAVLRVIHTSRDWLAEEWPD
ncbi:type II toxin-antitoxin system RelE/ParE family toxin [Phyllobacterium sp. BT25]|uniref:Type II toxin-antitoxin system RelE/ParE family toxin n=1 Tax=Phyllobacterium pellucidum TaxID=2740464 RepID=A0A849VU05_9HYPH|nr:MULTISPECIES: type II toxin-antitoxin system RelE/ParE family toxin [Phyllobacterium]NTS31510.1 type II toxin-antitoxin system RelE/ParE family toxin [Phyllobacterium pellucidum]UGY08981.1 type II toxin-antitoxin system RelE/ParE family toxin [Phyllobacterium sp. T1018]